jgi:imidazolonepropionase-like amidohydrolase
VSDGKVILLHHRASGPHVTARFFLCYADSSTSTSVELHWMKLFYILSVTTISSSINNKVMRTKLVVLFAAAFCLLSAVCAQAQSYAITNARVVTVSGATIDKGTVVIRDGLIYAVGVNITAPAEATVIDVNGSTVYPGFIDTLTNHGIPARPATQGGPGGGGGGSQSAASPTPVSNSNYPAGLRPEDMAENEIRAGDAQFESARNAGFTTALTTGRTGIFPGQSAIINLAGDSVSAIIVRSPFAQHVSFVTVSGGGYPGSLLGTFSALRQMLNDAKQLQENQRAYAADPRGMKRPEGDRSLEALFPVINRQMPVVFNANREIEIIRALDLIRAYNILGIIAGGQEAGNVADRLKAQNVPVLLSLNFPKRTSSASPDADPESMDTLRFRAEVPKTAGKLAAAGVKFAFQSGGAAAMADYFTNAGKSVSSGLSRDAAIRAMTLGAAELLGIDNRTGSIDAGKIANLVVIRGDILGQDRFASHVFIDGKLFEPKEPARPAAPRPGSATGTDAANLSGTYRVKIELPGSPLTATFNLAQSGQTLTGTMVSDAGTTQIRDGKVTGNAINFATTVRFGGANLDIVVQGTIRGDQISGTIDSRAGSVPFAGTKNP